MSRTQFDWEAIRAAYAVGGPTSSFRALGKRFGPSHVAVRARAIKEQWTQNLEAEVGAAVSAKLTGTVTAVSPEKKAAAIDEEANRRVEVIKRHRDEWNAARERIYTGLTKHKDAVTAEERRAAFDQLKAGKISAEALNIIQVAERRAFVIDKDDTPGDDKRHITVTFEGDPYAEPQANEPT